jgi:hypothetical protein
MLFSVSVSRRMRSSQKRYGGGIDHGFVGVLSGDEEPDTGAGVLAKAVDEGGLAVACQESGVDQQDWPYGGADRRFHAGKSVGGEPGEPGSVEAVLGFGVGGEDAVPGDIAGPSQVPHGIEEGAVEVHDLGVEAFDELRDGIGVVADGSGEDEGGLMGGGNGELVLGVVGDFFVFAFRRGHMEVTAEKHRGGAGDERAGNVAGRTGSAVELRGGIPSPIVSGTLEEAGNFQIKTTLATTKMTTLALIPKGFQGPRKKTLAWTAGGAAGPVSPPGVAVCSV